METLRFLMVSTFYPPYHLGGDAVHVQYLAEALAAAGHEVHVEFSPAAYGAKRPATEVKDEAAPSAVHVRRMTHPYQFSSPLSAYLLGKSRAASRAHERSVRETKPDVIHLHNISLLGLGVLSRGGRAPLLYTAHDYWFRCPRSDLLKRGQAPCESPACFSCMIQSRRVPTPWRTAEIAPRMDGVRCVIAPSEFMRRLASTSFQCPAVTIPNFVPDGNPKGEVGVGSSYFLYVGVLERHKGLEELAEAAARYQGKNRFILVGRGTEARRLRERAGQLRSRLEVRSWMDRASLTALYKEAAAFIIPSTWYENAPLAAIEALSWGVPILCTTRGGVSELIQGGRAGFAFEPNAQAILETIASIEEQTAPWEARNAARSVYELRHRPEAYLRRYLPLVRNLLTGDIDAVGERGMGSDLPAASAAMGEA